MYVPTLRGLGDPIAPPNPTPWVAGAIILFLAVFVPKMTKRLERAR
jgi:hypothetical protein